jgi:hypothetical protein
LNRSFPQIGVWLRRVVPVLLALAAAALWTRPGLLAHPGNDPLKRAAGVIRDAVPSGQAIPYLGTRYWGVTNPLLYYTERPLEPTRTSAAEALGAAASRSGLLLADKDRLGEIEALASWEPVLAWGDAVLVRVVR